MGAVITSYSIHYTKLYDLYSEQVEIADINLKIVVYYDLYPQGESTRLNFNVNWMGAALPAENKQGMMDSQATNLELLKDVCENNPA